MCRLFLDPDFNKLSMEVFFVAEDERGDGSRAPADDPAVDMEVLEA